MAAINQLKGLIEAQGKTIARQGVAIARHESTLRDMELVGEQSITSITDQPATKKARNEDRDNVLLTEARSACALLFAKVVFDANDIPQVTLAQLKPEFEVVLREPDKTLMVHWDRLHKTAKAALKHDAKFLATYASADFMVSNVLLRKIICGQLYSEPFGGITDINHLKTWSCLTHFAPPVDSTTLAAFRAQAIAEQNDQSFGQNETFLKKRRQVSLARDHLTTPSTLS
jgi:hypothetical protein